MPTATVLGTEVQWAHFSVPSGFFGASFPTATPLLEFWV